jgi:endonuclease/exonuclease/phosphatase family metal-dependent hydrolase
VILRCKPGLLATLALLAAMAVAACQPTRPNLQESEASVPVLPAFTVVTLNLWHDKQDWPRRQESIVATLATLQPDVVLLQEVLQYAGLTNQAESLAQALGYQYRFYSADPPTQARRYGNAILTRHRILAIAQQALSPAGDYRVAGLASVEIAGRPVNVYVTHLHHEFDGAAVRQRQAEAVMAFVAATAGTAPAVLGGDFNAADSAVELQPLASLNASA